jgi:hypothetical protein
MTDVNRPDEDRNFDDTVAANRAMEQGLGVGARELAAQRDPGGDNTADEDAESETGVSVNAGDEDALDQSVGVQGAADDSARAETPET